MIIEGSSQAILKADGQARMLVKSINANSFLSYIDPLDYFYEKPID